MKYQKNCHLSANQFELFSSLYKRLILDDTKDKMKIYEYINLSNPKKLEILLNYVNEITKDDLNESTN